MGLMTAIGVGPSPFLLEAGTSRGFIVVWDLRFQLAIHTWRHNSRSAITRLHPQVALSVLPRGGSLTHPTKGPLLLAAAEGTGALDGFDLHTGECRCLFRQTKGLPRAPDPRRRRIGATKAFSGGAGDAMSERKAAQGKPGGVKVVQVSPFRLPLLTSLNQSYRRGLPPALHAGVLQELANSTGYVNLRLSGDYGA